MFVVNDDLSIYANRGDIVFFTVSADDFGNLYKFQPGDIVRMAIYGKKEAETCVLQKDFPVSEVTEEVFIYLEEEDTKIGEIISKHKDYWYEVVLNPDTAPQTLIGYDEDGPKVFRLFPESTEIEDDYHPQPEDFPVVDEELDMTSPRPVSNRAIARAVTTILDTCERTNEAVAKLHVTPQMFGAIGDGKADDTEAILNAIAMIGNGITSLYFPAGTYLVSEDLPLTSNMTVYGDGSNSVIMREGTSLTNYNVFSCTDLENVTIRDICVEGERSSHDGTSGEWGMCIGLYGCKHITIKNCKLTDGWGDGVYIGNSETGCEDITIDNCVIDHNRRNGVSVIECDGFRLLNSTLSNTDGTAPKAGIDFEANENHQLIKNCIVDNCIFYNNLEDVCFYDRNAVQAVVKNCYMNSKYGIMYDSVILEEKAASGGVTIQNCNLSNFSNCYLSNRKHINSVPVTLIGCVMHCDTVAIQIGGVSTNYPYKMGDIHFVDCYVTNSPHNTGWVRYQNTAAEFPLEDVTLDVRLGNGVKYHNFYTTTSHCNLWADIKCVPKTYSVKEMLIDRQNTEPLICLNTEKNSCTVTLAHSVPFGMPITIRKLNWNNQVIIVNESENFGQYDYATEFSFDGRYDEVTLIHEAAGAWRVLDNTANGVVYEKN